MLYIRTSINHIYSKDTFGNDSRLNLWMWDQHSSRLHLHSFQFRRLYSFCNSHIKKIQIMNYAKLWFPSQVLTNLLIYYILLKFFYFYPFSEIFIIIHIWLPFDKILYYFDFRCGWQISFTKKVSIAQNNLGWGGNSLLF